MTKLNDEQKQSIKMSCGSGIDKCSCCRKRKSVHQVTPLTDSEIEEMHEEYALHYGRAVSKISH